MYLETSYTNSELGISYKDTTTEQPEAPQEQPVKPVLESINLSRAAYDKVAQIHITALGLYVKTSLDEEMQADYDFINEACWELRRAVYDIAHTAWEEGFQAGFDKWSF